VITLIRPLEPDDRPAATLVLDDAVGAGFWSYDDSGDALAFVADPARDGVAGVVLARLTSADDPDVRAAFAPAGPPQGSPSRVLHVRAVAVAPEARRAGLARRLLARAESEAAARGALAAFLFAWLPDGQPEPAAVAFYHAAGYLPGPDIPGFYAAGSLAGDAWCPYCGAPPCRCAARPFTKELGAV
jgi:GNAT superfamily N-acetyltransferase